MFKNVPLVTMCMLYTCSGMHAETHADRITSHTTMYIFNI